jgi:hypothetical protein
VRPPYGVKSLQTFVCGGVAAKFADEEAFFRILDRLMRAMGADGIQIVAGNDAIASRMGREDFLGSVIRIASVVNSETVRKVFHMHNARLMNKIHILEYKLRMVSNKQRFLEQFYDNPRTRADLRRTIDAWGI